MTAPAWEIARRDLRLGPRSPILVWALILPLFITVVLRAAFGGLFTPAPRLGIVDLGGSEVTGQALDLEGFEVTLVDAEDELRELVEANDLDAGLVLPSGFDDAVRSGSMPTLQIYIGGQSLASSRIVIAATTLDLIRRVEGTAPPVTVTVSDLGEEEIDLVLRLVPVIVLFSVAVAGVMVTGALLVEEREKRTLSSLLVSPASINDVLVGKGVVGWVLAVVTGVVTLALNDALGVRPLLLVLSIAVGAVMMVEVGLMLGSWAKDTNTLFTAWKSGGILLFAPAVFFIWPDLPQWIPRLLPPHYFLRPVFAVAVEGAGWADVWLDLLIAFGFCVLFVPLVIRLGRRLERVVATTA